MIEEAAIELWHESGGALRFQVVSRSMAPALMIGDIVEAVPATRLIPGDVVVLHEPGRFIVHRLVATWPRVITRGDARRNFDAPVTRNRIVGRVVAIERGSERFELPGYPWSTTYAVVSAGLLLTRRLTLRALCALSRASPPTS
jgi:signal peptidase I